MLDAFTNYFWQHPVAILLAAVAAIIILIWMTGSGSRQRFIVVKRTKETEQLARDLGRIASALEKIARQREIPMDYLERPIPQGWEATISAGEPVEDSFSAPADELRGQQVEEAVSPMAAGADHESFMPPPAPVTPRVAPPISSRPAAAPAYSNPSRNASNASSAPGAPPPANAPKAAPNTPTASRESASVRPANSAAESPAQPPRENSAPDSEAARRQNPFRGTADLLGGKKKLDLPNPLYRPKR